MTGLRSLGRRGYLSVALRTDEPCRVTVSAAGFRTIAVSVTPKTRTVLRLRRTTSRTRTVAIRIRARDAAGNVRTLVRPAHVRG